MTAGKRCSAGFSQNTATTSSSGSIAAIGVGVELAAEAVLAASPGP